MSSDIATYAGALAYIQILEGRASEFEAWLGLFVVAAGVPIAGGFQLTLPAERAEMLRAQLPRGGEVRVAIEYDQDLDAFVLTAL